jgi:hypothetical protein
MSCRLAVNVSKQLIRQLLRILELAFPNHQHPPSQSLQLPTFPCVPASSRINLRFPVVRARLRHLSPLAVMTVPETSVDENDRSSCRQYDVRRARQVAAMQAKSVAKTMQQRTHGDLGLGVRPTDARHQPASMFGSEPVRHFFSRRNQ